MNSNLSVGIMTASEPVHLVPRHKHPLFLPRVSPVASLHLHPTSRFVQLTQARTTMWIPKLISKLDSKNISNTATHQVNKSQDHPFPAYLALHIHLKSTSVKTTLPQCRAFALAWISRRRECISFPGEISNINQNSPQHRRLPKGNDPTS